jgi:2OG-Fe(II) oxygenase superfamily
MFSTLKFVRILSAVVIDQADSYRKQFDTAKPFRHVLIAPFFEPAIAEAMLSEFPVPRESEMVNEFGGKNRKFACHDVRSIGPTYRLIDDYISSAEFATFMERIIGIKNLLYDPEYHGAGTHDNMSGQGMDTHVDFNLHRTTGYHRRCNAIIYLNKEWKDDWGGNLELHTNPWDFENDKISSYPPLFNHCVLFETSEHSWHGFKRVQMPDGREISRKSFTIYMYTKDRPAHEIAPKHGTIYVQPGPPRHFRPGYALTTDDVQQLKSQFRHRNGYLQGMYERESGLLEQLGAAKQRIEKLSERESRLLEQLGAAKQRIEKLNPAPERKWSAEDAQRKGLQGS